MKEREADYFARCLLMPSDIIKAFLEADFIKRMNFDEKVKWISSLFNVTSKKATQILKEDLALS